MMKIIFSPSKEMRKVEVLFNKKNQSIDESFKLKRKELLQLLKKKNNEEISNIMKIKGKLLEETIENYRKYDALEELYAISLYNGVAYKELNLENRIKELQKQNIRVISVINLSSIINTDDDNIIRDFLEKYQLENLEYPDQEKFNSINLNGYKKDKSKYKEIDWAGYNWLVVLFENETKKYYIQVYKHLENLKYEY